MHKPSRTLEGVKDLVDERSSEFVVFLQNNGPEVRVPPAHQVACLALEERVLIAHFDDLLIALAPLVGHARQVRVTLLAVLAHHAAIIVLVLPAVNINTI